MKDFLNDHMPDLRKACDLIRVGPLLHEKLK